MANAVLQGSFAAGELSPALYARVDLAKYASGAALLRNFYVDYRGGASTRPGTEFIGATTQGRLLPFIVSTLAAYILVLTDHKIQFVANGAFVESPPGTRVSLVAPWALADLQAIKVTQSADVMTFCHPSYPVYNLTRVNATTFSLDVDVIGPVIAQPQDLTLTPVGNTTTVYRYGYVVAAISATGEESIASNATFVDTDILNQVTGKVNVLTWDLVDGAQSYRVYKNGPVPAATSPVPTTFGFIGSTIITTFTDNNIAPDFSTSPPEFQDPFSPGQIAQLEVTSGGATYTDALYALTFTGGGGSGAAGFAVTDPTAGTIVGAYLTHPGSGYTTPPTVDDGTGKGAVYTAVLGQLTGTYPTAPGYFQQRRLFGGTPNFPEAFVASQPGQYNNFDTSPITQDSDAITASLASLQVNAIKAFVSVATGLIVFTTGGGFLVSGGGVGAAITPSNLTALPQPSSGCNDLPPIPVNTDVLYAQNRGSVVRDLAFNFYVQSYSGTDRSVLASHLFAGFKLLEWTYAEEPFRLVQVVRNDGTLLVFTYVPEQEIYAWTHYDTNGLFKSIASIPEGDYNATYVIAARFINGVWVYYVERFASGLFDTLQDAWCLDCAIATPDVTPAANITLSAITGNITVAADVPVFAVTDIGSVIWANTGQAVVTSYATPTSVGATTVTDFQPVPNDVNLTPFPVDLGDWLLNPTVSTVSGLGYLNNTLIGAVVDGNVVAPQVVTGGSILLPNPGSRVLVGLGYQCQFKSLRLDTGEPTSQGKRKIIPAVTVIANRSLGLYAGMDFITLDPMQELISSYPPRLISTEARQLISTQWDKFGQVCLQQDDPLPATILGIIPEVTLGDTMR